MLLIPSAWVPVLTCLDGRHTGRDVQELLVRHGGGELVYSVQIQEFVSLLRDHGYLETREFFDLKDKRHAEFRASTEREPVHAGEAYPNDAKHLREVFDPHFSAGGEAHEEGGDLIGLAAPHVSLEGGWDCYAAAYSRLDPSWADKTFVILGTSHYGQPDRFGLTRKSFSTPLGRVEVDEPAVDFLIENAPDAVEVEDYCHAVEHSIEFQTVLLRYRLDAPVKIVPILCGPFLQGRGDGEGAEVKDNLQPFFHALTNLHRERSGELFYLLGIDLAHIGKRYGDPFSVRAGEGAMLEVESRDRKRLEKVCEADVDGFWDTVQPQADALKWCGFSPLYTFLTALGPLMSLEGRVLEYQQWSIDPESVVSFVGMEFREKKDNAKTQRR
jgi:AmmeMemoRadiSam system protein B